MSYKSGICAAIAELDNPDGSSSLAIKQHMQANQLKGRKWIQSTFASAIRRAAADGIIVKVDVAGHYKYNLPPSKEARTTATRATAKKAAATAPPAEARRSAATAVMATEANEAQEGRDRAKMAARANPEQEGRDRAKMAAQVNPKQEQAMKAAAEAEAAASAQRARAEEAIARSRAEAEQKQAKKADAARADAEQEAAERAAEAAAEAEQAKKADQAHEHDAEAIISTEITELFVNMEQELQDFIDELAADDSVGQEGVQTGLGLKNDLERTALAIDAHTQALEEAQEAKH